MNSLVKELIQPLLEEIDTSVALYPGKFKPPHKGHFAVAKQLLDKANEVIVVISPLSVDGITAQQSEAVWNLYKTLLGNKLTIKIVDKSPIKYVLDTIKENPNSKFLVAYGKGEEDRYKSIVGKPNVQIVNGGTISDQVGNFNATDFRNALKTNQDISRFLPEGITSDQYEKALGMNEVVKESSSIKKLRVFDFDDTLAHVDAKIHITHADGSKEGLNPAEYAVYEPKPGDTFNFKEFSSIIKKVSPIKSNIDLLIKSFNTPNVKTTILTARLLGYPIVKYLKDEYGIRPYVVGLGSSDPEKKREWIEQQIQKGYNDIKFMDDSSKNIDAVSKLKEKYPNIKLELKLINEEYISKQPNYFKEALKSLTKYMIDQDMNVLPLPKLIIIDNDLENSNNILGKTAHYNPSNCSITLYTLNRHPKDILRSYAHEIIHRIQDNEDRLTNINTTNTNEDGELEELEKEAYLKGNMTFRNWEDSIKNPKPVNEVYFLDIEKYNYPKTFVDKLRESLYEITLSKDNAVKINGDLTGGEFQVGNKIYIYSIKNIPNPYNDLGKFYNIQFTPQEKIVSKPTKDTNPKDYIKILSTMYKIIVDFVEKETPKYIGIASMDNTEDRNYHTVYANLTDNKFNRIPGYFRKDVNLPFDTPQGKGRMIILKRKDEI